MEIKELTREEIRHVYKKYLTSDFVPNELRPLHMMETYLDQGNYLCLGLYDDSTLLSVAFMYQVGKIYLLDYLDTLKNRGKGYGSLLIKGLFDLDIDGIYVEVESIQENDEMQIKRQHFYKKNGFVDTTRRIKLYFVDYDILYLPIKKSYDYDGIIEIYDAMYPTVFQRSFIKIKR